MTIEKRNMACLFVHLFIGYLSIHHGNTFFLQDDVSLEGFNKHITSQNAPAPLTQAEEEVAEIKKNEVFICNFK